MRFDILEMTAFKVYQISAFNALQMKMVVAVGAACILIAGALSFVEDILPDDMLFTQLLEISVYRSLTDFFGLKCKGNSVRCQMTFCIGFYVFKYQLALTGII